MGAAYILVPVCFKYGTCETFRSFPFVHIVLEEFDYTARIQHALVAAVER